MSGKPWFRDRPELRERVGAIARELQPELSFVIEEQVAYLRGTFIVAHEGEVFDRYKMEIEFPHDYENGLPTVHELEGKIPRIADRHMERDGCACLFLNDEFWWYHPEGLTFQEFLGGVVRSYFICQTYYDKCQERWLLDDQEHGAVGSYRFYADVLETDDFEAVLRFVEYIERGAKGHWGCPCGSGDRVRDCHRDVMWELQDRIPADVAAQSLRRLKQLKAFIVRRVRERRRQEAGLE